MFNSNFPSPYVRIIFKNCLHILSNVDMHALKRTCHTMNYSSQASHSVGFFMFLESSPLMSIISGCSFRSLRSFFSIRISLWSSPTSNVISSEEMLLSPCRSSGSICSPAPLPCLTLVVCSLCDELRISGEQF